jgi:hypothetical protein
MLSAFRSYMKEIFGPLFSILSPTGGEEDFGDVTRSFS